MLAWVLIVPIGWALSGPTAPPAGLTEAIASGLGWLGTALPWTWAERLAGVSAGDVSSWLGPAAVPSTTWALTALAVGAGLALTGLRATVHAGTIVHELGHGLVGGALGARILAMVTSRDGSGHVVYQYGSRARVRSTLSGFAGYPSPGILALAGAHLALAGLAGTWLIYLAALMAVMLVVAVRSWWAALVALGVAVAAILIVAFGSTLTVAGAVLALSGALAVQGCRGAHTQWARCRSGQSCDATIIAGRRRRWATIIAGAHVLTSWALAASVLWLLLGRL